MITYEWDITDGTVGSFPGYKARITFADDQVAELKAVYEAMDEAKNIFVYDIAVDIPNIQIEVVHPNAGIERITGTLCVDIGLVDGKIVPHTSLPVDGREGIVDMYLHDQPIVKTPTNTDHDH